MVQRLIASAVVVMALGSLGWTAGGQLGDPLRAHRPLPEPVSLALAPGCHLQPQLEMLPRPRLTRRDMEAARGDELLLREQLVRRTAEVAECAKFFGEPGAEQLARITVSVSGIVRDVEVQGPFVSDALIHCVESKASRWSFRGGPTEFVMTLPVQYCP
jgi:hypothetical protein